MFLASCANGGTLSSFLTNVQEKGMEVQDTTFDAVAKALDGYCGVVPSPVRSYVRMQVNERTQNGDVEFCRPE